MTNTTTNPQPAEMGRDTGRRAPYGPRSRLAGMMGRISTKTRWMISAAVGLITPAVLMVESAAAPIAEAMACFGNGSFMTLAATANAFTLIP